MTFLSGFLRHGRYAGMESEKEGAAMNDMKKIVKVMRGLLAGKSKVEVAMDDPRIEDIVDYLHYARVRLELSTRGLAVDFPLIGEDGLLTIHSFSTEVLR